MFASGMAVTFVLGFALGVTVEHKHSAYLFQKLKISNPSTIWKTARINAFNSLMIIWSQDSLTTAFFVLLYANFSFLVLLISIVIEKPLHSIRRLSMQNSIKITGK
jgi:hypothetical protein